MRQSFIFWLKSGSVSSEAFKMGLLMLVFTWGVYFVRHDLPRLYSEYTSKDPKSRAEIYEFNKRALSAAHEETMNAEVESCKERAKTREALIVCLDKVYRESAK